MSLSPAQFRKVAVIAAREADSKKAEAIQLLDLRHASAGLSDYVLIASANSETHLNALRDHLEETMEGMGLLPVHREGFKSRHWTVLDYGGFLIHIFHRESRHFYSLERLWEDARELSWRSKAAAPGPKRRKARPRRKR